MSVQDVDRTRSVTTQLETVLESVHWMPEAVDYAFLTYSHGGRDDAWMGDHMHYDLPNGLKEPDVRYNRALLRSHVPDAFGVQVLRQEHVDRAAKLDSWHVDELAPGRYLVYARDLGPWLRTPEPAPENPSRLLPPPIAVMQQARADFGEMIMSRRSIDENSA